MKRIYEKIIGVIVSFLNRIENSINRGDEKKYYNYLDEKLRSDKEIDGSLEALNKVEELYHDKIRLLEFVKNKLEQEAELSEKKKKLQDIEEMLPKDKHELIKSNIASNRKIKDLEAENEELAAAYNRAQQEIRVLKGVDE